VYHFYERYALQFRGEFTDIPIQMKNGAYWNLPASSPG